MEVTSAKKQGVQHCSAMSIVHQCEWCFRCFAQLLVIQDGPNEAQTRPKRMLTQRFQAGEAGILVFGTWPGQERRLGPEAEAARAAARHFHGERPKGAPPEKVPRGRKVGQGRGPAFSCLTARPACLKLTTIPLPGRQTSWLTAVHGCCRAMLELATGTSDRPVFGGLSFMLRRPPNDLRLQV